VSAQERAGAWAAARHPVDVGQLVVGVALLVGLGAWALLTADVVSSDDVHWLLPLPWLLGGAAGLVAAVAGARRRVAGPGPGGAVGTGEVSP